MIAVCYICGLQTYCETHHVYNGVSMRAVSERLGLKVPLCGTCHRRIHNDAAARLWLKVEYEKRYLAEHDMSVEDWIALVGKNYV